MTSFVAKQGVQILLAAAVQATPAVGIITQHVHAPFPFPFPIHGPFGDFGGGGGSNDDAWLVDSRRKFEAVVSRHPRPGSFTRTTAHPLLASRTLSHMETICTLDSNSSKATSVSS
jgi:hypothetical protein